MNYKREIIGDNIGFSTITDEKFNTCSLYIRFITELTAEDAVVNSILSTLPAMSNSRYRTMGEISDAISELYGASLNAFSGKRGDAQIIGLSSSWICNRFALENEDITKEMLAIFHDCIFSPNVSDGKFDSTTFKISQKNVIDTINSQFNDKRVYAINKAYELAFRGEPAGNNNFGTIEQAENVTPEMTYRNYMNLLETAQIEIFYIAPEENRDVPEMFRRSFSEISRHPRKYTIRSTSPVKPEPAHITEEFDINQSKMVLVLKSDSDDMFASDMFNIILGGSPVSKLFTNVREKMSLCYYCSSNLYAEKKAVIIDIGVDRKNIDKAYSEIFHQIDEMKNGNISDEEIQSALLALDNAYSGVGDTPGQCFSWYFSRFCSGNIMTPQEYFQKFCEVTKERIIKAANSFRLDSSYYMLNKEAVE
ncbi:MAG: insulinase family protein [Ruminococcus flavefaciens]|nr:insulinase family protein [Ruminococcus flavefaciens]MCM1230447.1 insulinase family protein [Ruminococcus flavefaciens]